MKKKLVFLERRQTHQRSIFSSKNIDDFDSFYWFVYIFCGLNLLTWYWFFPNFLPHFSFPLCWTEAAPEAVKRKAVEEVTDAAEAAATDETAPTPEKKSKVEEAAHENGGAEEVVA